MPSPATQHSEAPNGASLPVGYELFGKSVVPIHAKWVLDFALDGWRSVQVGNKRQIQASFRSNFRDVMIQVDTRKGTQWKIDPTTGFILLGYGPTTGESEHDALQLFRRSRRKGGWFEGELYRVTTTRKAIHKHREYQEQGGVYDFDEWLYRVAPDHWGDIMKLTEEELCRLN